MALLLVSLAANYFVGLHLGVGGKKKRKNKNSKFYKRKRMLLAAAIIGNLSVLVFYKTADAGGWSVTLPLGISFYTFQILSYLIDVYRGDVLREFSFVRLSTYVTMFPRMVSGPIFGLGDVKRDLERRTCTAEGIQSGLKLFVMGLVSKVLLADRIGILWHEAQTIGFVSLSTGMVWLAAIAYSLQLYFDFYGYSLMASGLGRMLGFELPDNFHMPYMARTVREFYRRWHITLGRWFCRYVYVPMGGSRKGELRTALNLLFVWFLTSLWHGFTPNFLLWGGMLWACIVIERQLAKTGWGKRLKVLPHLYLWAVIPVTWMCFAITDMGQLEICLGRMFGVAAGINVRAGDWIDALQQYWYLFVAAFVGCTPLVEKVYRKLKDTWFGEMALVILFWLCVWRISIEGNNPFMYRHF
ncbi:MAG: hypothetical protein NC417_08265 [Candidatus Gastranaerophilales bacterium]|nr:hypothetical protein [Candidatus Gastranaerophilales bacterium]